MKKKTVEVKQVVSIGKDVPVCQNCKAHKNNPSFCKDKQAFVGRKQKCENFR